MAERDMTEKHLEGYNDVFADVVNVLLFKGERRVKPEDLEDARARTLYKADGKLHEQERDVSKLWVTEGAVISLIGFENQTGVDRDMALRVLGYEGADYRGQLSANKGLYPVVTLVLYFGEAPWTGPRTLFERVSVAEGLRPFVNDYRVNVFEIPRLTAEQAGQFRSDFRIVADYFVQMGRDGDYVPPPQTIEHVDAVLKLLSALTRDHRFEATQNEFRKGEDVTMLSVLEKIEARGLARGLNEGRIAGLNEGRIAGLNEGRIAGIASTARRMLARGVSPEQVVDFTGLSPDEVEALRSGQP